MTYKEIRDMDDEITLLRANIARLKAKVTHITSNITAASEGNDASGRIDKIVPEIADLEEQLKNLKTTRADAINKIPELTLQGSCLLLFFKYHYSWTRIAIEVGGNNTADSIRMMCYRFEW